MRRIFLVVKDSPAGDFMKERIAGHSLRDGDIIFMDQYTYDSWLKDVTTIELNDEEKTGA